MVSIPSGVDFFNRKFQRWHFSFILCSRKFIKGHQFKPKNKNNNKKTIRKIIYMPSLYVHHHVYGFSSRHFSGFCKSNLSTKERAHAARDDKCAGGPRERCFADVTRLGEYCIGPLDTASWTTVCLGPGFDPRRVVIGVYVCRIPSRRAYVRTTWRGGSLPLQCDGGREEVEAAGEDWLV